MKWADLTRADPRLQDLEQWAVEADGWGGWESLKNQLRRLCGHFAERPELRTAEAYEVAYRHLLREWESGGRADQIHTNAIGADGDPVPERNRTQRKQRRNAGSRAARQRRRRAMMLGVYD